MYANNFNILVIGDLMIDYYIYGNCSPILPEAPVPVVEICSEEMALGGAGNVLNNLKSFGCETDIYAFVGKDANAAVVSSHLKQFALYGEGLIEDEKPHTSIKSRVLANNHQLVRLNREDIEPISEIIIENILIERVKYNISRYAVLLAIRLQ